MPVRTITGLAAAVQLRLRVAFFWVANFDSEVPALNRRELGSNPRRPTISASVVKLQSSSASNGESAGGSPAGCTNSCRVSPTTRGAPLRPERLGWKSLTRHHFAHVVQCRDGALKTRTVPVQIRPWAPTACSPMQAFRSKRKGCRCKSCHADQFALNHNRAPVVLARGSAGW